MRKNIVYPGLFSSLVIAITGFIVLHHSPNFESPSKKTAGINAESSNMKGPAELEFLSDQQLRFISNHGQAGTQADFHVQGAGHTVLFHKDKIILRRVKSKKTKNEIVLQFEGANRSPSIEGSGKLPGVAHFFKGSDPQNWQTDVPTFSSVLYRDLYPGIDMAYIGDEGILESEFYISPGIDYHQIQLDYQGIKSKRIGQDGSLVLETNLGELVERAPIAYQEMEGSRMDIGVEYELLADGNIGFRLDDYRKDLPLVIDPELVFLRSISTAGDGVLANGVVIDHDGNIILAGDADRFFEVTDSIDGSNHNDGSSDDCILLKLDGNTGEVIYSALLGGTESDFFNDVAIDGAGNLYLTGQSSSSDFPVLNATQGDLAGSNDAFFVILDTSGQISYSTFLGGTGGDWGSRIVLDGMGNTFISGGTRSTDFPIVNAYQQQNNGGATQGSDNFIAKFNAAGSVAYATYLGGSGDEFVKGLAVNESGEATIVGYTKSTDYPTANAYQNTYGGGTFDMIYTRLNSNGNGLIFSSYYGGSGSDISADLKPGPDGDLFVAGRSTSTDFPVVGGQSFPEDGIWDGVVIRIDSAGNPVYSVRSNLTGFDSFTALAVDDSNTAYPVGTWGSTLWIYQKTENDSLNIFYDTTASGHNVNDAHLKNGYLALAGTYWGSKKSGLASKGAKGTAAVVRLVDKFKVELSEAGTLTIFFQEKKYRLVLDVNEEGIVTVNGKPTTIKAEDVKTINVFGTEGDDDIDLSKQNSENFKNLGTGDPPKSNLVVAGKGDDIVKVGSYKTNVQGGEGDDIITGSNAKHYLEGGPGDDHLYGGDGQEVLDGGPGKDKIFGGKGDDHCLGGDGEDFILGEEGNDHCEGGNGSDDIDGGEGNDKVYGNNPYSPGEKDKLKGDSGDDVIIGGLKSRGINGGKGKDKLKIISNKSGSPEKSLLSVLDTVVIEDSQGIDTLDFSEYDAAISINLTAQDSLQMIDTSGTQVIVKGKFEVFFGTNFNDSISVSPLPDTALFIDGGAGMDVLNYWTNNPEFTDNGSAITTDGFAEVVYINIEKVNLPDHSTGIDPEKLHPALFRLDKNYPNPFVYTTTIKYRLGTETDVNLSIYSLYGQLVTTLVNERQSAGEHSVRWYGLNENGQPLNAGIYIYELVADGLVFREKMLLQK